jgi:hypothetical protein
MNLAKAYYSRPYRSQATQLDVTCSHPRTAHRKGPHARHYIRAACPIQLLILLLTGAGRNGKSDNNRHC